MARPKGHRDREQAPAHISAKVQEWLTTEIFFYERQSFKAQVLASDAFKLWPVKKSASIVADHAHVSKRAVEKWRREAGLLILFWSELQSQRIDRPRLVDSAREAEASRLAKKGPSEFRWGAYWPSDGVVSPINGRRYRSQEAYERHVRASGAKPRPPRAGDPLPSFPKSASDFPRKRRR